LPHCTSPATHFLLHFPHPHPTFPPHLPTISFAFAFLRFGTVQTFKNICGTRLHHTLPYARYTPRTPHTTPTAPFPHLFAGYLFGTGCSLLRITGCARAGSTPRRFACCRIACCRVRRHPPTPQHHAPHTHTPPPRASPTRLHLRAWQPAGAAAGHLLRFLHRAAIGVLPNATPVPLVTVASATAVTLPRTIPAPPSTTLQPALKDMVRFARRAQQITYHLD